MRSFVDLFFLDKMYFFAIPLSLFIPCPVMRYIHTQTNCCSVYTLWPEPSQSVLPQARHSPTKVASPELPVWRNIFSCQSRVLEINIEGVALGAGGRAHSAPLGNQNYVLLCHIVKMFSAMLQWGQNRPNSSHF